MRGVPADKSAAMMAPKQKVEKPMRIMGRLFGYILRRYKLHCLGVLLFIFGSTAATVAGNLFMKTLIDDYIVPYIGEGGASDFGPLLAALLKMGCVFLFGVLCTLLYNRIMVYVSQGTMRAIRDDLFRHMERLPIRYFDTHAHGDIMSIYTNDIDTLRQMISQSMPQLVSSAVTIVSVFCSMPYAVHHQKAHEQVRRIFRSAAAQSGHGQRLYRGDDGGPESRQGILPRG
mgnify:CR=1 FL=1